MARDIPKWFENRWVVTVDRRYLTRGSHGMREIYACVPKQESAESLKRRALEMGYSNARVEILAEFAHENPFAPSLKSLLAYRPAGGGER